MEQMTKNFDMNVPIEVRNEVRHNMEAEGWTFKNTTKETDKMGQPFLQQHYEKGG